MTSQRKLADLFESRSKDLEQRVEELERLIRELEEAIEQAEEDKQQMSENFEKEKESLVKRLQEVEIANEKLTCELNAVNEALEQQTAVNNDKVGILIPCCNSN